MKFFIKIIVIVLIITCAKSTLSTLSNLSVNNNYGSTVKAEQVNNIKNDNYQSNNSNNENNNVTNNQPIIDSEYVYLILNKSIDVARMTLNLFQNALNALENNQKQDNSTNNQEYNNF